MAPPIIRAVPKQIVAQRRKLELSLRAAADQTGLSRSTIFSAERGEVPLETAILIPKRMKVPRGDLEEAARADAALLARAG